MKRHRRLARTVAWVSVVRRGPAVGSPPSRLPAALLDPADVTGSRRRLPGRAGEPVLLLAGTADLGHQRRGRVRHAAAALLAGRPLRGSPPRPLATAPGPRRRQPAPGPDVPGRRRPGGRRRLRPG